MLDHTPIAGDVLRLPSGRHVLIEQVIGPRADCIYCDATGSPLYGDSRRDGSVDLRRDFLAAHAEHVRASAPV